MEDKITQLRTALAEVDDIQRAGAILGWDQQTYMPAGGAARRGAQLGTLASIAHKKFTSVEVGKLLEALQPEVENLDPDSDNARLVKVAARNYEKALRVPNEWVSEFARVTTVATQAWQEARAGNDFSKFQPHLEKIVDMRRQFADFFAPYDHAYDPLLDVYEPGLKTAEVREIFNKLRPEQVAIIKAISEQPQIDDAPLHQVFDEQVQWEFGVDVISRFGYDWSHGRQDKSPHPFTISFGIDDVRITTRIQADYLNSAIFGSMHECGHALYEAGIDPALARTPLEIGASLAFHESQSRMYENLIGRSRPFWEFYYPKLQNYFPDQLAEVDLDSFYRAINRVEPSPIRVEADEATYNLHIMLRLELEIALMEGKLEVADLPVVWNERMEEYLGLSPQNDAEGVLQDIHWSNGMIGYFSTYALGNLISVQLWEKMLIDIPDLNNQIRSGNFKELLGWLREHIHAHGCKFEPQELIQRVVGSKIDPAPYINYLKVKFGEIYQL